ncbi:transposase [Paenibacillus yanchengensis]|uniref:Transposase n=1 Tax=Paenibacillus yanchengensis TaxID=2035833 RepID=A0ABW4YGW5_9BACL
MIEENDILAILFRVTYIRDRFHLFKYPFTEKLLEQWRLFLRQFPNENACYTYLYDHKWPDGFRCPKCNYPNCTKILTRRMPIYQCHQCYHQTTLTANTIMELSRLPLQKWLMAFFFLSLDQIGVNAFQLHLLLQVTYKTAWTLHRKVRQAISQADFFELLGKTMDHSNKMDTVDTDEKTSSTPTFTTNSHTCGIMFERAPQHKPVMIGFEMNSPQMQADVANHSNVGKAGANSSINSSTYSHKHTHDPLITHIKLKLIPTTHMVGIDRVSSPYVATYKHLHFEKHISPDQITHAPRMSYRQRRAVQKAFDYMIRRFIQTYGTIKNKYLQFYFNEMCFYYEATIHQYSIFHRLSKLSMIYKAHKAIRAN